MNQKHIKKCSCCSKKLELNKNNFYWRKDKNNFRDDCKKCCSKRAKKYRSNNKQLIKKIKKEYNLKNKEKITKKQKEYYLKNKDKINKKNRENKLKNKDKIKEKNKEYNKNNKEQINKNKRDKCRNDPKFRARKNFSSMFRVAIKKNNINKNRVSCFNILQKYIDNNYTIEKLKQHIESQFEHWMNWENWGKYNSETWDDNDPSTWTWNIDHIIPQSKLPYDSYSHPNFKKCWALENLRPLNAKQNLTEGNHRETDTLQTNKAA